MFVARDGRRLQRMAEILEQLMPGHPILTLPAWDCLPYDRVSPNGVTIAARMSDAVGARPSEGDHAAPSSSPRSTR